MNGIAAVVIILLFIISSISSSGSPSKVVKSFFSSVSSGNLQKAGTYLAPNSPWDTSAATGGSNVKIAIENIEERIKDDDAVVYVRYSEDPEPVYNSG